MPLSGRVLCAVYAAIALVALIATWRQNVFYLERPGDFLSDFVADLKLTPASRSITVDIALFFLAAAVFMVLEARKHRIGFVWAYILGGALVAISVTFPLFLIARQLRLGSTEPIRLRAVDVVLMAVSAGAAAGLVSWLEVG